MRNLKLDNPRIAGRDVEDWQQFLSGRGLFTGAVDGVFGPLTAKATRDYQARAGLGADGVAGPATFARAIQDGFQSSTRAVEAGMDASVNCTSFAACIASTGMRFAVRYYSRTAGKKMRLVEARALCAAGLKLVVVYQDTQNKIEFFSSAQGSANAQRALDQASALGQPAGSAIYFAADFDPSSADVRGPITDYFQAVNQVFRAAPVSYEIGVYGSGLTCRLIRDASLAKFAWLSGSTGFTESNLFRPHAHLIQVAPARNICNGRLNIDDDIAQAEDYGAFQI